MYKRFSKRILDVSGAVFLLVLLFPLFALLWVVLLFYNKGKVFFVQMRPGKDEKPFKLYKFRTMKEPLDENATDFEQITGLGNFLRKTSLDEIPQVFNIIKGDMSFVGPRPLLMEYLPLYSEEQRARHSVLPGITGWAQVNGRNSIGWAAKFVLDLYYIKHISFWMDFKIVLITILNVFNRKHIYTKEGEIVEKFKGNQVSD